MVCADGRIAVCSLFVLSVLEDQVVSVESADSGVQTLAQTAVPISVSLSQSQTTMPITVQSLQGLQGCQQVRTIKQK